jgi:lysyl-tRNA synthetase class 2
MTGEDWRPTARLETLRIRAAMLARMRAHFAEQRVLEVQTPALSTAAVTDLHIESVPGELAGLGRVFLHTSPEYAMKRLLAAGLGDCFQVCQVFRDRERGREHNPEFTLVEWYRLGYSTARLMDDVDALLRRALEGLRSLAPAERLPWRDAVRRHTGADLMHAGEAELCAVLARHGVEPPGSAPRDREALLDLVVSAVVGPRLGRTGPTFIYDYPAAQAALARIRPGDPALAERFELYLDGLELANGFCELADAAEQRRRFEQDLAARAARGLPARPLDERLLAALAHGLPDCAGVALGFDRLVMTALGLGTIDEALAFPVERT